MTFTVDLGKRGTHTFATEGAALAALLEDAAKHRKTLRACRTDGTLLAAAYRLRVLQGEVDRLKSGHFTYAELHDLCHTLADGDGGMSAWQFADGCAEYQRKLFGCAPDRERATAYLRRWQAVLKVLKDEWPTVYERLMIGCGKTMRSHECFCGAHYTENCEPPACGAKEPEI